MKRFIPPPLIGIILSDKRVYTQAGPDSDEGREADLGANEPSLFPNNDLNCTENKHCSCEQERAEVCSRLLLSADFPSDQTAERPIHTIIEFSRQLEVIRNVGARQ